MPIRSVCRIQVILVQIVLDHLCFCSFSVYILWIDESFGYDLESAFGCYFAVEAASVSLVACGADLLDFDKYGITVAVHVYAGYELEMS